MKIVFTNFDNIFHPHYNGGGAKIIHSLARYFAKNNDVSVITSYFNPEESKTKVVDKVKYISILNHSNKPKLSQVLFQISLPFSIKKFDFDVVLENSGPPFTLSMLPIFCSKPVIATIHMLPANDIIRKYHIPLIPKIMEKITLSVYSTIVVLSKESKEELNKINPKAYIKVINNGIQNLGLQTRTPNKPRHILYIGRIEINQKGLDLLVKAYSLIKTKIPLLIVGSGEDSELQKLNEIIKGKNIKYLGRIDGKSRIGLFKGSYAIALPSRFETFSIVALESFFAKVPLVCFDIPGMKWLSSKYALKATPFEVKDLAKKITTIISSKKAREKYTRNSKKISEMFSERRMFNSYKSLVDNMK